VNDERGFAPSIARALWNAFTAAGGKADL